MRFTPAFLRTVFVALPLLVFSLSSTSQTWTDLIRSGADLEEVEEAFRQGLTPFQLETGKGIKPFERLKYFWESRTIPEGQQPDYWNTYLQTFGAKGIPSKDAGNWTSLGMADWEDALANNPGNGRVNTVYIDPSDPSTVYVGTPAGGLWKSEDTGNSWTPMTDNLPTLGVSGIAVHPDDSDIIYMATGDGDGNTNYGMGVLKTTNGGESWSTTGMVWTIDENIRSNGIIMHPTDSETLFVWTTDGLYKTTNGGLTWYLVQGGDVQDVEFHPSDPNIVYACTNRFYRSLDGGEDFDLSTTGLPSSSNVWRMELAVSPDDADRVYALACNSWDYGLEGLYVSESVGEAWEQAADDSPNILGWSTDGEGGGGQGWYDLDLCVNPNNADHVFVGGVNLWETTNGGSSWEINAHWVLDNAPALNYVHADIHYLGYAGNVLYCGSDGGIFRSSNHGNSFQNKSAGLEIAQYYRFDSATDDSEFIFAGAQDNGCNLLTGGDWFHVLGADGMGTLVHPTNADILFGSSQYGGIRKSVNGGNDFEWAAEGIDEDGAWVTPYMMSPANPDVLIAGFENVWRSTDLADSWVQISDFSGAQFLNLGMSAANPNVIYACTENRIYRTGDGGGEWIDMTLGLPQMPISSVTVNPIDEDEVWVTHDGFADNNKIFHSTNAGEDWENMSANLPNIPTNCLAWDGMGGLYIGTDFGIFYTDPTLAGWESFNQGLPHVIIQDIQYHENDGKILAGTYGRGMWTSDVWEAPTTPPTAQANFGPEFICVGDSVFYEDLSIGNAPGWDWTFEAGTPASLDALSGWVTYNEAGMYDFSLETSNANGSDVYACDDCVFVFDTLGVGLPLSEGFENPDLQFSIGEWFATEDEAGNGWRITDQVSYGGDYCAWINNYTLDTEESYALSSQPFDLTGGASYTITFRVAYAQITDETNDRLRLYTSTDCGESWSLRQQYTASSESLQSADDQLEAFAPASNDEWNYYSFDLPESDLSSHTAFQFWFLSDNGNNIYLDNINIIEVGIGEQTQAINELLVYPNPGSESCTIEYPALPGSNVNIVVVDAGGRAVIQHQQLATTARETTVLETEKLEAGWYVISVQTGGMTRHTTWLRR